MTCMLRPELVVESRAAAETLKPVCHIDMSRHHQCRSEDLVQVRT